MAITLYDSIDLATIPPRAQAVAGYVGGHWPTFKRLAERWPDAYRLSVAVQADENAQALDVEAGDATPAEAPGWLKRQHRRGIARPIIYGSLASMPAVLAQLRSSGLARAHYRLWVAHWTGKPHLCDHRCLPDFDDRAGATQYTDRALGRNLDASLVYGPDFFRRDR